MVIGTAVVLTMTTSFKVFAASDWKVFSFYLYPNESSFASAKSIKDNVRGYAQVKTQSMIGGGTHKIIYSIHSGSTALSVNKTVTCTGTVNISYNITPTKNEVCKLKGYVPSTQNSPLRVEGDWIS